MQGNWPGLPNWVFSKVVQSSALSEAGQTCSSSRSGHWPGSQPGHLPFSTTASTSGQISTSVPHFNFTPMAGKAAIGGGLAAVLQAAGGLLRLLGRGGEKFEKKLRRESRHVKRDVIRGSNVLNFGGGNSNYGHHVEKSGAGTASLLLNKVTSLLLENLAKIRNRNALPTAVVAMLSPLTNTVLHNSPTNFLPFSTASEAELEKPCTIENFEDTLRSHGKLSRRQPGDGMLVEPKTGVCFPVHLEAATGDLDCSDQVLAGVGARAKTVIKFKSIMIYAFGLYVQPDQLREKIGEKFAGVPPEELKYRPDFYDDLLSQGVDMTVRLVVHYKGLKMGMVRSAFETSLKARLKKIKGAEEDNGLNDFCSLMSKDVTIFQGTIIDFRWQPGGTLQTEIGGQRVGTIFSHHLCRAFFSMYIGDPPVSEPAKLAIGESFARLLMTC